MIDLPQKFESALSYDEFARSDHKKEELYRENFQAAVTEHKAREVLSSYSDALRFLVLAETWCGDVIAILPVIQKLLNELPNVELRVISRDENPDLMEAYLSDGKKSVPKLIIMDEHYKEIGIWGPRPQTAMGFYKQHTGLLKLGLIGKGLIFEKVKKFYKENKGREVQTEIAAVISAVSTRVCF